MIRCILLQNRAGKVRTKGGRRRGNGPSMFSSAMGLFLFSQPLPQKKTHQLKKKQTRLAKYYVPLDDASKRALEYDVHRLTAGRDSKLSNVVEVRRKIRRKREENDDDRNEEKTHHLFLSPPKKT